MSSTNKTSNLGLNQWELKDVYQMSDFNQDNAKIDAAMGLLTESLTGNLRMELIKHIDAKPTSNSSVSSDLSDVNFGDYYCVIMSSSDLIGSMMIGSPSANTSATYSCLANGFTYICFPHKNINSSITGIVLNGGTIKGYGSVDLFKDFEGISFISTSRNGFPLGFSVDIWGIK